VPAFIEGRLGFTAIAELVAATLAACPADEPSSLDAVLAADRAARQAASRLAPGLVR